MTLPAIGAAATMLGGHVIGRSQIQVPGPGHSSKDRSLVVSFDPAKPDGFGVWSYAKDDFALCRDHVRRLLRLDPWTPSRRPRSQHLHHDTIQRQASAAFRRIAQKEDEAKRAKALWIWNRRKPITGTIAERYLRECRRYRGELPPTLGFLPPYKSYPPALIAGFGVPSELDPRDNAVTPAVKISEANILSIADGDIRGIHITRLLPDGSDRERGKIPKLMLARSMGTPIVLATITDNLTLEIAEGIETSLSVHEATGNGTWAAGCDTRLPALADVVPHYIEFVTVTADPEPSGVRSARELCMRLRRRGIAFRLFIPTAGPFP